MTFSDSLPAGAFRPLRPLVLASSSPRRRELLGSLGLSFAIKVVDGAEPSPSPDDDPASYAMRAAQAKATAVARTCAPGTVVIGADTIVVLPEAGGPVILGKPAGRDEALAMLLHLSGRTHTVCTGCCIVWDNGPETFCDTAGVSFASWPEPVLSAYAATGECDDKAGAYAIQGLGSFLVSGIRGQWPTIVGLPVLELAGRLLAGGAIAPRQTSMSISMAPKIRKEM